MSEPRRVAVVGGGLSGLAAAHRLTELQSDSGTPLQITLFEASGRLGGVMGTKRIGDYLVETGADSFITNKPWAVKLCERLGLADRLISTESTYRRSLVLRNGKPVAVPEGFQLLTPAKIWPVLKSPLFSPLGKLRMAWEYFVPRNDDSDESLASFVRRRFGTECLDRLVQPLVGGIYTSDPEKLSLAATMPRFLEMEREHRSLIRASRKNAQPSTDRSTSGARYGLFATLAGGISELLETLAEKVQSAAEIRLNAAVSSVSRGNDNRWQITLGDGSFEEFDGVILALPAYRAGGMIEKTAKPLADLLSGIEYASSAIVVSGHRLSDIAHPVDAFGLVIPAVEHRKILAVSFTSRKFPDRAPEGCVQLRTFVGGAMQPEELDCTDEELTAKVRAELAEILGVSGEPDFVQIARWNRAMPQYHLGHVERVQNIEQLQNELPGFQLAGNAYHGVGVPDCIHSGENAAEALLAELSSPAIPVNSP